MRNLLLLFSLSLLIISCSESSTKSETVEPLPAITDGVLDINGAEIYHKGMGKGEPMIVVHGGPGMDHSYFLPQMEILAPYYSLIFYDQLASGKSTADVDSSRISVKSFVDDIEALRKALELDNIHLMGHSWGGYLAMQYGIRYPDHLSTLILLNPMSPSSEIRAKENKAQQALQTAEDDSVFAQITGSDAFKNKEASAYEDLFRALFRKTFYHKPLADSLTLTFPDAFAANSQKLQYLGRDLGEFNILPALEEIEVPTLLIYGAYDPLAALAGDSIHKHMPGSHYKVIEECGHFPFIEQPAEFVEVVNAFIQGR